MNEERLVEIEMKMAHQEQQIGDLSEVVLRQGREIDVLKAKLRIAEEKMADMLERMPGDGKGLSPSEIAARDKPPHY